MKLKSFYNNISNGTFIRSRRQSIASIHSFSRKFCAQAESLPTISLRSRDSDNQKRKENEEQHNRAESIIHRRTEEEYNRQQAILNELQDLKQFIEENGDNPIALVNKLKSEVYGFDASKTTALHRCESMRRMLWLCTKYLSDNQWFDVSASSEIEHLFIGFSDLFLDSIQFLSVEEVCDILWTYAVLGLRPSKLITRIVSKIDRVLLQHKKDYFGYEQSVKSKAKSEDADTMRDKAESFGYVPGSLQLPFKHNEFADIMYAFGCLRIESGNLISLLDAIMSEHYAKDRQPNRLLDGFLPRDLRYENAQNARCHHRSASEVDFLVD